MVTTIPKCSVSEMIGLLEILNDYSGSEEIARLARDYGMEIDEILPAVEIAEALKLVKVEDGNASLTDDGNKFIKSNIEERKNMLKENLRNLQLFSIVLRAIEDSEEKKISSANLANILQVVTRHPERYLRRIINWGRYTQLFNYDSTSDEISL